MSARRPGRLAGTREWAVAALLLITTIADGGDIWITDLELQTDRRFTFEPAQDSSSPLPGERTPKLYPQSTAYETHPQISPDGRWLSYSSNGVWVHRYPTPGTKYQVTFTGGQARWRADGQRFLIPLGQQ